MPFKNSLNNSLVDRWGQPISATQTTSQNARKLSDDKTIIAKIVGEFQDSTRAEIQKWRQALTLAKNPEDPRAYLLQDMYDNLESDGHFIAERELRKAATLCADFSIINRQTGDIEIDKTELFKEEWFYNFREDVLDHFFKGYTVLELTNPYTLDFTLIPRRNVQGKNGRVYLEVAGDKFITYTDPVFASRIITIGKTDKFGLMSDLCGQLIWKRNAQQSWAEFTEKYGQPLITATTNKTAESDINKIDTLLRALGEAARAVLPEGTTIDIKPFTGGDSFNVFDKQIQRINSELSRPIIGGTMITGEGSSRSQSEVHERNLDEKIAARDKLIVEYVTNNQLLPIMQKWGHDVNPEIHKFRYDSTFELTVKEHWEIVDSALDRYEIPDNWVSKTFNIPIDGKKKQEIQKNDFKPTSFAENFR